MNRVYLHGELADLFGPEWRFDLHTAREAISALGANCQGFLAYLKRNSDTGYHVVVGDVGEGSMDRSVEELYAGIGEQDVHIFPSVCGAKQAGWTNIIIGAVLVVAGAYFYYTPAISMGVSMILGGVATLLTSAPSVTALQENSKDDQPNYLFNGPINTQAQGQPVPVGYGMLRVGGAVASTSVSMETYTPGTDDPNGVGFRITNLPSYYLTFPEDLMDASIELHATGGTGPYTFSIVSQFPDYGFFSIVAGSLEATDARWDAYTVVIKCVDAVADEVTKTLLIELRQDGDSGHTPT
jgi:predicted phage tail protein